MDIEEPIYYEDVIKAIDDFENKGQEIVNKKPNVIIPYYTLDHLSTELSMAKTELKKKDQTIKRLESINKFQSKDITKAVDYTFELNAELEKKDKIIELMTEELRYQNGMQQDYMFCIDMCDGKSCDKENCKERIKQYFEKKVEERSC